jgi:hypothetical protein
MKKLFAIVVAGLFSSLALAQTYPSPTFSSLTLQNPLTAANGGTGATTSTGTGSVVLSNSPSLASPTITGSLTATGLVTLSSLATQAANTVVANVTGSSASPAAFSMPSCSGSNNALRWTSGTGFACASSIALTTSGLNQFASTTSAQLAGVIPDETGSGSLVFGTSPTIGTPVITGGSINNASVGATTPSTGAFTTLTATTPISVASGGTGTTSPHLIAGTNVSVSGTWPNQTVSALALPVFDVQNVYAGNVAAAATAANTAGGGILWFSPNTTFTVSSAISLGANVSVVCGPGSVIQTSSATADIFDQAGNNTINQGCTYGTTVPRTGGIYVNLQGTRTTLTDFAMNNAYIGVQFAGPTAVVSHGFINASVSASLNCSWAGDAHIYGVTSNNGFNISGYISGTTLTVTTAAPYNSLTVGQYVTGTGITAGTFVTALGTGTGGAGTYTVNNSQTAGSSGSPITIDAYGTGSGLVLTGNGNAAGCAITMEGSGMLEGLNSIAAVPPSGGTVFLLAADVYLDNPYGHAVYISPASGGAVGYVKVTNSELGVYSGASAAVLVNIPAGGSMGNLNLTGNSIYSYVTNTLDGVQFANSVAPESATIGSNDIGVQGSPFAGAISINYSGSSNAVIVGNSLKATTAFFLNNTSDVSCIFAQNRLNGSGHTPTGCNQNNNY